MPHFIRLSDYKHLFRPSGPLFVCIIPWLLVLIGQQLALCEIIIPHYSSFYLVVIGNIFTALLAVFFIQTFFPQNLSANRQTLADFEMPRGLERLTMRLLICYLLFQCVQVVWFQGFPLFWLMTGNPKGYFDFGFPSLNGLFSAIYLFSATSYCLIYLKEKSLGRLCFLGFIWLIPIILVSRQLFISVFFQSMCCYLIYKPNFKKLISVLALILLAFVVVGNLRTGLDSLVSILEPKPYVPQFLYSLLWLYAYVVTPFNNLNAAVDYISPLNSPYYELQTLLPSIFRDRLPFEEGYTGFMLVHPNMMVSTFYLPLVLDFGQLYAFVFMALFQLLLIFSYRKAMRTKSPLDVIKYAIFYMIMALSLFSNLLLYLPVAFQLCLVVLAKLRFFEKTRLQLMPFKMKMPKIGLGSK